MSALKTPNFSNGKWLHEISLSAGADEKKQKVHRPFKNDGTSIVVKQLPTTITKEQLTYIVEDCIEVMIKPVKEKSFVNREGKVVNLPACSFAFMSFPSRQKAYLAMCALHERKFQTISAIAMIKKSKAEIEEDRRVEREKQREEKFLLEVARRKVERKAERKVERKARKTERVTEPKERVEEKRIYVPKTEYNGWKQDWFCPKCKALNFFPRSVCFKVGCKTEFVAPEPEEIKKKREEKHYDEQ